MIDDDDHETIEAVARKVLKEMAQQKDFRVEPEAHYGQHKEIGEIDSTLETRHLDQHKWVDGLIKRWNATASMVGNAVLMALFAAVIAFLTWIARLKP